MKDSKINFNRVYKKIFNKYKHMNNIGAYAKIGAEDIVQDGIIRFIRKYPDLSAFNDEAHLFRTIRLFILYARKSIVAGDARIVVKDSKHEKIPLGFDDTCPEVESNKMYRFDKIDLDNTTYAKLYYQGYTQIEIGKMLGYSGTYVATKIREELAFIHGNG
jgi:hypothetical protein